jgi:hypothetical protein
MRTKRCRQITRVSGGVCEGCVGFSAEGCTQHLLCSRGVYASCGTCLPQKNMYACVCIVCRSCPALAPAHQPPPDMMCPLPSPANTHSPSADRFRVEVLFSAGASYNPVTTVPPLHNHTLPAKPRMSLHRWEGWG